MHWPVSFSDYGRLLLFEYHFYSERWLAKSYSYTAIVMYFLKSNQSESSASKKTIIGSFVIGIKSDISDEN